jgi:hypothetical protein
VQQNPVASLAATMHSSPQNSLARCFFRQLFVRGANSISIPFPTAKRCMFPESACAAGVVEEARLVRVEMVGHFLGAALLRQRPFEGGSLGRNNQTKCQLISDGESPARSAWGASASFLSKRGSEASQRPEKNDEALLLLR